jgi:hypothetical protein
MALEITSDVIRFELKVRGRTNNKILRIDVKKQKNEGENIHKEN